MSDEDLPKCRNCWKKYLEEKSDAEDCEQFCSKFCESEYGSEIDSDEKAEYFQAMREDSDMERELEIRKGVY